jgi:hypothetical protein
MLRFVALARTDVSVKFIASIIRMTRIGELGITSEVTSYLDIVDIEIPKHTDSHFDIPICFLLLHRIGGGGGSPDPGGDP